MKMTFSKVTQWMAKNRPLVTLKQSGVNTVRTKCQQKIEQKKLVKLCVYIYFRPKLYYYYFEFTSLDYSRPRIFFRKIFFVKFEHTYNTHFTYRQWIYTWCKVTFHIFEVLLFKKWLELLCFLILILYNICRL